MFGRILRLPHFLNRLWHLPLLNVDERPLLAEAYHLLHQASQHHQPIFQLLQCGFWLPQSVQEIAT